MVRAPLGGDMSRKSKCSAVSAMAHLNYCHQPTRPVCGSDV